MSQNQKQSLANFDHQDFKAETELRAFLHKNQKTELFMNDWVD